MSHHDGGSNPHGVSIPGLLRKTEHYDKDERYMATSDLCEVLKRQAENASAGTSSRLEASTERQICTAVLRLLHDKSNDVQAIAVKTLGVLLTTVQQEQVLEIADSLADQVLDVDKSELRDVYAIGLRTLVKTIPLNMGNLVCQRLTGRLLDGVCMVDQEEIVLACMDILTDLLGRFGSVSVSVTRQHEPILQQCLVQLGHSSPVIRKRAGNTLGVLSTVLSDTLLQRMVESLLGQIDQADGLGKEGRRKTRSMHASQQQQQQARAYASAGDTRSLIRTMCTVSGAVGHRLKQDQIDRILPIFLRFTDPEDAATGDDLDDDEDEAMGGAEETVMALANELRESCFMGFESFVLQCPRQVEPHLESIVQAALAYMSYDPNYSYGEEQDEDELQDEDLDDEDDEYEAAEETEDEDDDDDDDSWKVRRAALRVLKAVVEAKMREPSFLWTRSFNIRRNRTGIVASELLSRFKEREENCRVTAIECFTRLLAVTTEHKELLVLQGDAMDTSDLAIDLQNEYAPKTVRACEKILSVKKGNERSKSCGLSLLATLCQAPKGVGGEAQIASVFKHVKTFLADNTDQGPNREGNSKALRLDALSLVLSILECSNHDASSIRMSLRRILLPELCESVKEQWYKVIAEALRVLAAVPKFFVEGYSGESIETQEKERAEVAPMLYAAIEPFLSAHDVDQEIKECALKGTATLLSWLHASLSSDQQARLLLLLLERLRNETTRTMAIKALSTIASATGADGMAIDLSSILPDAIVTMASFLKLSSRSSRQSALEALDVIVSNQGRHSNFQDGALYSSILPEFVPMLVDHDLHLTHLSLRAAVSILEACPAAGPALKAHLLEKTLALAKSTLLQEQALESLLALLKQMVISNAVDFNDLLFQLRHSLDVKVGKTGVYNLAECIATITATTTAENAQQVVEDTLALLEGSETATVKPTPPQIQLALLITGDLGRMKDLGPVSERLKTLYVGYFDSSSEELKHAAAYALGKASVGSQSSFLPAVVGKLEEDNKKQQYLLLLALREFIHCTSRNDIKTSLPVILPPLERHCSDDEEGVRSMVAECLGSLTRSVPEELLKKLANMQEKHSTIDAPEAFVADEDQHSKKNAHVCWTVATSIKLAVAGKFDPALLEAYMPVFVELIHQQELSVRNAALLMIYSILHHMPKAVAGILHGIIVPAVFAVSKLKLERKVDLGPFKHTVDDAVPLRKTALSIFATCLENFPTILDVQEIMPVLALALADAEDIQLHAHQIIISMCTKHPGYLVGSIDTFVEPLEKTLNKKPGQKTGTELERLNDWIKSALRVVLALSRLEGATSSRKFADFVERVRSNEKKFKQMLTSLEEEQ